MHGQNTDRTRWASAGPPRSMEWLHHLPEGSARAHMTDSTDVGSTTTPSAKHTVVVPNSINMVSLLGPGDEHLGLIEKAFAADVHVRGNRITIEGPPAEIALAERLLEELVAIIRTGQGVTPETVERVAGDLVQRTYSEPHWDAQRGAAMAGGEALAEERGHLGARHRVEPVAEREQARVGLDVTAVVEERGRDIVDVSPPLLLDVEEAELHQPASR